MITPFKANGDVDLWRLAANIRRWNEAPLAGYLAIGSNKRDAYLSERKCWSWDADGGKRRPGPACDGGHGHGSLPARPSISPIKCAKDGGHSAWCSPLVIMPGDGGIGPDALFIPRLPITGHSGAVYNVTKYPSEHPADALAS
jgi:hypothetical protein